MKLGSLLLLILVVACGSHAAAPAALPVARELPGGPQAQGIHAAHASPAPTALLGHLVDKHVGVATRPEAQDLCLRADAARAAATLTYVAKGGAVEFDAGAPVRTSYVASLGEPVLAIGANGLEAWLCGQDIQYPEGVN